MISNVIGYFTVYKSLKGYPEKLRKVVRLAPDEGAKYIFLTNNLTAFAEAVSQPYRNRWSVELFFKWIKRHLCIKKFWGYLRECSAYPNIQYHNHLMVK